MAAKNPPPPRKTIQFNQRADPALIALLDRLVADTGLNRTKVTEIAIRRFDTDYRAGVATLPPPVPPVTEATTE